MWASAMSSAAPPVPTKTIPGSYGLPVLGPLKDRLDYFWFQGPETYFRSRVASHKSTVFRTNMPPTFPFFVGVDPRVVAVLDCSSFSVLFDRSLVDKRNVLVGDYMPSISFTGDTRVVVYLDPSEPDHARVKSFCLDILKRSAATWASSFHSNFDIMFDTLEREIAKGGSASGLVPVQQCIFNFLCRSIVGADPSASPEIGSNGFAMLDTWLALQLMPVTAVPNFPQPLQEILLHSIPYPSFFISGVYRKLYEFVEKHGEEVVLRAETEFGIDKKDAINNILFVLGFNAFGGFSIFLPALLTTVGTDKTGLRERLREEVRRVMQGRPGEARPGFEAVREMELVRATVYETLRLNPPVPLQYGRARDDFTLRSHDAAFQVRKGELLCGYQPLVMRDPEVFEDPETFSPERFKGAAGKEMLKYLFWSNGPQTGAPTAENKQCAAKDYVVETACLLLANIFLRYDEFVCADDGFTVTKLQKAAAAVPVE
ncbi:fatty acid hydroperoxide lyase, chloroplastic-like [Zingiber officinale]|uniref:Hydroperoxide lyase n=1 Tax=Zingiber officinale TaxID=94328 RepID=A0A8J5F0B2_ZINOF|nr:fatty acid hydroperoxide lyase, chloroplastic-like [Zingiber officinale]XP_042434283.1 fatty acid hydroperoxide lyase, chloroplastic-like [Zingiber officinale]KAG6478140.1 hypothetical protein ZIOFF_061572 [Zingiber officinale]KAG6478143.1 hypothetical protein ZIOFF_061575 [Zingiber officinale]